MEIREIENPRSEAQEHYYNPTHTKLLDLGLQPTLLSEDLVTATLSTLMEYAGPSHPRRDRPAHHMAVTPGRVLVTGGAVSSASISPRCSADLGYATRCFDDFSTGWRNDAENAAYDEIVDGDVLDLDGARRGDPRLLPSRAPRRPGRRPASVEDPLQTASSTSAAPSTHSLAARDAGVAGFVFASSNAPLGEITPPAHEDVVPRPRRRRTAPPSSRERPTAPPSPAPTACRRRCCASPTSTARSATTRARWSPRSASGRWPERRSSSTATATQTRDFVFVEDLSRGIAAAVSGGGKAVVAHLASGTETTVLDVARMVAERFDSAPVEHRPARIGDVARSASDISTARELFGFAPRVSLEEGLDRTVAWFRESGG